MGATYTWTFEQNFLIFALIIFVTQVLSTFLKAYVPMPLLMGWVFALCFGMSPYRGIAMCAKCITGFPVNQVLVERFSRMGENPMEQAVL